MTYSFSFAHTHAHSLPARYLLDTRCVPGVVPSPWHLYVFVRRRSASPRVAQRQGLRVGIGSADGRAFSLKHGCV